MTAAIADELAGIDLGDQRRNRRICDILGRLMESPSVSLTAAMHGWAEMMAAYRLIHHPQCTAPAILGAHQQAVLARVREQARVLLIQDTTELDYTTKTRQQGRGPLSTEDRQGYFLHTQWAVSDQRLPLGAWDCQSYARPPKVGVAGARKAKPIEEKESFRWLEGYRHACKLATQAPQTQIISCSDREGDIYEVYAEWQQRRQQGLPAAQWLIRCNQNRALLATDDPIKALGPAAKLVEEVLANPVVGGIFFEVPTKKQFKLIKGSNHRIVRQARRVRQEIRYRRIRLRPPYRPGHKLPGVDIWVVMATELDPPPGQDPIDWVILTSLPVAGLQDAIQVLQLYLVRWEIEVFHRVLKSGCKVEQLQFKTSERIHPLLALYVIVAWRILYLVKLGRECPDLPCDVVFAQEEWQSICRIHRGPADTGAKPSLREMIDLIAYYGGYTGRRSDAPPGPEVMWRGLQCLRCFALAWRSFGHDTS
jgi:hypothetical protein